MDLFVGTGQLTYFWDKQNTIFVPPKEFDVYLPQLQKKYWEKAFVAFAKGDTFQENRSEEFYAVNVVYTEYVVKELCKICDKVYFFSTSELWNKCQGPISLEANFKPFSSSMGFDFDHYSPYINSKAIITEKLFENDKVILLFPFSFNSPFRKEKRFLFGKIFNSIINQEPIEIGNIDCYRDMMHPKFVAQEAILAEKHKIIGSGRVIHVGDFVRNLYAYFGLDFDEFVKILPQHNLKVQRNIFYLDSSCCLYSNLFEDTVNDISLYQEFSYVHTHFPLSGLRFE